MKKKLKTTARRANHHDFVDEEEDYNEEPSMKLSRAFLVVLILHIVAVAGIFLFNKIQMNHAGDKSVEKITKSESDIAMPDVVSTPKKIANSPSTQQPERHHFVRHGESLADIAVKYRVSVAELELANNLQRMSGLKTGQELIIPASTQIVAPVINSEKTSISSTKEKTESVAITTKPVPQSTAVTATHTASAVTASGKTYTVKKGDNPYAIAKTFHVDYKALLELNKIEDPKLLKIGQVLELPPSHP